MGIVLAGGCTAGGSIGLQKGAQAGQYQGEGALRSGMRQYRLSLKPVKDTGWIPCDYTKEYGITQQIDGDLIANEPAGEKEYERDMISGIPLCWALGPGCEILMFLWSLGLLESQKG